MRIQPRQELLDLWQATVRLSFRDGEWIAGGNSISDAEQLLCIMAPATQLPFFRLDRPDATAGDVAEKLRGIGDGVQIPVRLIRALTAYVDRYTAPDGTPTFAGGDHFRSDVEGEEVKRAQRDLDVVDSFAVSVTLMLAATGFLKNFREVLRRPASIEQVDRLAGKANRRLTAALTGLLRSFAVNVFPADSDLGRELVRAVNQERRPARPVVEELRAALREVNVRLRDDVTIGSGAAGAIELDYSDFLFECGWSWGVVRDAPAIETVAAIGTQKPGVAQNAPYLYFTAVAMDAIQELSSERTRLLGLLDPEQVRLAQSLQLRFELARSYWATVATFGGGRWPLEDLPWRTTDGVEADYFSLLVGGMVLQNMQFARTSDGALRRVAQVFEDIAARGRITRRSTGPESPFDGRFPLAGSEDVGGPTLVWTVADLAATLLRRTLQLAAMLTDDGARARAIELSDAIWTHLHSRMITDGPAEVSWYHPKRAVDCLVAAAHLIQETRPPDGRLGQIAESLLNEAEHLLDRELLDRQTYSGQAELDRIGVALRRARSVLPGRPGVAVAIAEDVLRRLDRLAAARRGDIGW